jgi:hypothetical protein
VTGDGVGVSAARRSCGAIFKRRDGTEQVASTHLRDRGLAMHDPLILNMGRRLAKAGRCSGSAKRRCEATGRIRDPQCWQDSCRYRDARGTARRAQRYGESRLNAENMKNAERWRADGLTASS